PGHAFNILITLVVKHINAFPAINNAGTDLLMLHGIGVGVQVVRDVALTQIRLSAHLVVFQLMGYRALYTRASMRKGPLRDIAARKRSTNVAASSARAASTPMPRAMLTQSRDGVSRSSMRRALRPGSPAPIMRSSFCKMA